MSRPKPKVLLRHTDKETHLNTDVLATDSLYAVFYGGKPFNLSKAHSLLDYPGPKYIRIAHANPGHAFNLAEKLNKLFSTDKFEVYLLGGAERVTELKK